MNVAYEKGLHEVGDGLFAYLQPDGGWGWSNAGLICGEGTSLLVDTLYDLHLTREMLAAMEPVAQRHPIDAAVNTHANPDHCFGNELLPSTAEIYASAATAGEMDDLSPEMLQGLKSAPGMPSELAEFVEIAFGPFDFAGISVRHPSQTFQGQLDLRVGDRSVTFLELGPAHTAGDTIIHVPGADAVFTGDLLFVHGTPIVWASLSNWISACDRILALNASLLIPGHGPVTDTSGVRDVQRYLRYVQAAARERFEAGMSAQDAADDIDISPFSDWGEPERLAANVLAAYRELDPGRPKPTPAELFVEMARWRAAH
ncbi:MAG TPA: MBL fold metallo-hydrolase [Solirubrobacteraceae bacterium]|jgi:glyoxylase-like metal-dependent hydrolase (beta-lactamase superfamily II)|nr:MBL fold metallo-hydrolase [Solirubrobacteraceae bacterium]